MSALCADRVPLRFAPRLGWVELRELNGLDERGVTDVSTDTAIRLLDRLAMPARATDEPPGSAADLAASDRDRLLVAVYRRAFGDRVTATVDCSACGCPFDLSFSLSAMSGRLEQRHAPVAVERLEDGAFRLADGARFRLPTGRDECAVSALDAVEAEPALQKNCQWTGGDGPSEGGLSDLLDDLAPIWSLDLEAKCPECHEPQAIAFDIQAHLLGSLLTERRQLTREIHCLASAYGWTWNEILELPRSERRALTDLLESGSTR